MTGWPDRVERALRLIEAGTSDPWATDLVGAAETVAAELRRHAELVHTLTKRIEALEAG